MKKHLVAVMLGLGLLGTSGMASADISVPHLETTGSGEITVQPDMAVFSVAVEEVKPTAQAAKQAADQAVTAFVERLLAQGLERSQIQSANISLQPQYTYPKNNAPQLKGYRASRTITVTVNELDNLNMYLDSALGDGINRINAIELKVRDEKAFQEQARQAAIQDAISKAESLAKGFGEKLDGVWQISYQSNQPRPIMMRMAMDSPNEAAMTYQDAQIIIRDQVAVTFKLED